MAHSPPETLLACPADEVLRPRTFAGWALEAACRLDTAYPSTLASFFCASSLRRQAIFCALAEMDRERPEELAGRLRSTICTGFLAENDQVSQIAHCLVAGSPKLVLEAIFGTVRNGLVGALRRIGDAPFASPATYRSLHDLFVRPEHRCRAKVLGELSGPISETTIKIIRTLDAKLLRREIVSRLWDEQQALELQQAVALAKGCAPDLTDEVIAQSIRRLSPTASLSSWLERLLRRATQFPNRPPIEDDDEDFRVLGSAEALRDAGLRYRNCLGSRIVSVALGRAAYAEFKHSPVVIELVALSAGQWLSENEWGPSNGPPEASTVWTIRRKLRDRGILLPVQHTEGQAQIGLAKLLNEFTYRGLDLQELEHAVATA
jgi:hypothetical protein